MLPVPKACVKHDAKLGRFAKHCYGCHGIMTVHTQSIMYYHVLSCADCAARSGNTWKHIYSGFRGNSLDSDMSKSFLEPTVHT